MWGLWRAVGGQWQWIGLFSTYDVADQIASLPGPFFAMRPPPGYGQ